MERDSYARLEAGWERSFPILNIAAQQVQHAISSWREGLIVRKVNRLPGGHRNTNLRVILSEGLCVVLRFYSSKETCRREERVLSLLHGRTRVPRVFHSYFARRLNEPSFLILEFVAGQHLDDVLLERGLGQTSVPELGRAVGEALAGVHQVRLGPAGLLTEDLSVKTPLKAWDAFILETLEGEYVSLRLGERLTARLRELVLQMSREMSWTNASPCLVHGDFKPPNILIDRLQNHLVMGGIIDWEFSFSGPALFDVGSLLRYEDLLPGGLAHGVEEGYVRGGGSLPPDWRRRARLLDLVNLCDFAGRRRNTPVMHREIRTLISKSLAMLEA